MKMELKELPFFSKVILAIIMISFNPIMLKKFSSGSKLFFPIVLELIIIFQNI